MKFEIRRFDIYRKIPQDLTEATLIGAFVSLACIFSILILLIVELNGYLTTEIISELLVESAESGLDRIPVKLNISLIRLPCNVVGLDIQDSNGRHEIGFIENTVKTPLSNGKGCLLETEFYINKVPGNFHVSTHSAAHQPDHIDMSHIIHVLRFGDKTPTNSIPKGGFETLNHKDNSNSKESEAHEYHLKIVPSIYEESSSNKNYLYQYTSGYKSYVPFSFDRPIPAIWFRYDFNPITIKYKIREKHFYSFITMMFALIGGTFTVAGIMDSLIFTTTNIFKKFELGKLN